MKTSEFDIAQFPMLVSRVEGVTATGHVTYTVTMLPEMPCGHCRQTYAEHIDRKCAFEASNFKPYGLAMPVGAEWTDELADEADKILVRRAREIL